MKTLPLIIFILLPFSIEAAPQQDVKMQTKLQKIAKIENPSIRVLGLIEFALEKIAECPANIDEVSLNVAAPDNSVPAGAASKAILDPEKKKKYQDLINENSRRAEQAALAKRLKDESTQILNLAEDVVAKEVRNKDKEFFASMIKNIKKVVSKL